MLSKNLHFYTDAAFNIALTAERQRASAFVIRSDLKRQSLVITRNDGSKAVLVEMRANYDDLVRAIGSEAASKAMASKDHAELLKRWCKGIVYYTTQSTCSLTVLSAHPYTGSLRRGISYSRMTVPKHGYKLEIKHALHK